jgi:O-antigen/teichoic acid export membrane protein
MEEESLKYKTKKGLYWKFFDQFMGYGMQFVVGIFMARLLSPSDYGITALPAVFMAVAGVFISGGFGSALVRKENLTEEDLATAFYYSIVVGFVCYVTLFFLSPYIADFYSTPVLKSLIRVTALGFLWGPLGTPQSVILNRKLDFKNPARISVVNKIIGSIVGITMAYMGYGLWALVFSGLVSSLIGLIQTWLVVKWLPKAPFSKKSFKYLWNYGNKMMGVSLLYTLYGNIVPVLLGKFGGTVDLGNYNRAAGYASMPSSNIAGVITGVSFPVLSKMQDDDERLAYNYRKMIKVSSFVVFPIMMLLSALAYPIVITMVTAKWEACIILLQIMCFTYMFQPMQILNVNLLNVKGRTDLSLRLEIFKKIVGAVVFIYAAINFSLEMLCVTDFFYTMFALVCNTYYTGKLINVGYFKQIKDILPFLCLGLMMFGLVTLSMKCTNILILQIFIGLIVGASFYIGVSYMLKFEELNELKYLLNRKR